MGRNLSSRSESPDRGRGSPHRRSPSRRERSPLGHRSSRRASSPSREKSTSRTRSPRREKSRSPKARSPSSRTKRSRSPKARSPSPQTKRLRRAQAERESEKVNEREHGNHRKGGDRTTHREREADRELQSDKKGKRSGRDAVDVGSSRSKHRQSISPPHHQHRSRHRSRSPHLTADDSEVSGGFSSLMCSISFCFCFFKDLIYVFIHISFCEWNGNNDSVSKMRAAEEALAAKEKEKPSFELSGKLAAETNRVRGVTLLFNEPADARKPDIRWRLYVFKGGEVLNEPLYVHRQTCYLFGRERRVADIPTDHPSCSKQHAVLQYRQVEKEKPDGTMSKQVRPYLMDLGSTNGTFINDNRIEPQRYYELFEKDTIKFGNSSREYVLLHENSAG
ncbi:hypothetical protein NMG60_11002242 [Bertholletia excelsa]